MNIPKSRVQHIADEDAQDVLLEFVNKINFNKQNVSLDLTAEEVKLWDEADEQKQSEFRQDVFIEVVESAEYHDAEYALVFDHKKRILLIARYDSKTDEWESLETDETYRPKDTEIFKL